MTVRRQAGPIRLALAATLALGGLAAACTTPGASAPPSASDAMMEHSAAPSPSDAMMEHSAAPSDAMMEHSPSPS